MTLARLAESLRPRQLASETSHTCRIKASDSPDFASSSLSLQLQCTLCQFRCPDGSMETSAKPTQR